MKKWQATVIALAFAAHAIVLDAAQGVVIREIVPAGTAQPPVMPGPDAWGAGAKLAAALMSWLADQALKVQINQAISKLDQAVKSQMPTNGGVLVVVGIQQATAPDATGHFAESVIEAHIGTTERTSADAVRNYTSQPNLEQGADAGFVRKNLYFWLTN